MKTMFAWKRIIIRGRGGKIWVVCLSEQSSMEPSLKTQRRLCCQHRTEPE